MLVYFSRLELPVTGNVEPTLRLVFSRKDYTGPPIKKLIDVIDHVKPTALLGLSTVKVGQLLAQLGDAGLIHLHVGCIRRSGGQTHGRAEPAADYFPAVQPRPVVGGRVQERG